MKQIYKKVTMLIAILLATGALMAQQNTTNLTVKQNNRDITTQTSNDRITNKSAKSKSTLAKAPTHKSIYLQTNVMRAQWDILQEFSTLNEYQAGLETNGTHFFTSTWNDNYFQRYDMDGSNGVQFAIAGVGQIKDMAYVESTGLFYGSDASMNLYAMDLENQTLVSTISVTCSGVSGIRHIAYDPQLDDGAGGFWIGNWSNLGAIDMNGNQLVAGVTYYYDMYGSAYDNWTDPANPKLWLFCQSYVSGDNTMLAEYDINTQSFTGTSYDVIYDGNPYADAGGACSYIRPDGTVALVVVIQNSANPSIVREYEFATITPANISLSPTSHDYGNVSVGTSTSYTFTLTNMGGMAAEFEDLVISGANASFFDYQNDYFLSTVDIPAGGSVTIDIEYNPTAVGDHTAIATFETSAGNFIANLSGKAWVPVTGVSLDMTTATIVKGDNQQLTATVEPVNAANPAVTWSSSNNGVATVDNNGLVTGVSEGTATITVTTEGGSFTAICLVTVKVENMSRYITLTVQQGEDIRLKLCADKDNTPVKIVSGDKEYDIVVNHEFPFYYTNYLAGASTMTIYGNILRFSCTGNNANLSGLDVSDNTALTEIYCSNNQLSDLDVSQNRALTKLWCSNNQLRNLNVSQNTGLKELNCENNQLHSLDVNSCSDLSYLSCSNNQLSNLDISSCLDLSYLSCYNNQLSNLDVSNNNVLKKLFCFGNSLTTQAVDQLFCALPVKDVADKAKIYILNNTSDANHSDVLASNKQNALAKNWKVWYYDNFSGALHDTDIPTTNGSYICGSVAVTSVSVTPTSATIIEGNTQQLTATVMPVTATNKAVTWSSNNNGVATVNNNGLVTAHTAGTADITVETVDGGFTAICTITVNAATIAVTGVSVTPITATIIEGNTQQLTATVMPITATNKAVTWSSNNNGVATVNNNGLVTAHTAGTADITVETVDGGFTAICTITVNAATIAVTGVSVTPTTATIIEGNTQQLTATVMPITATNKAVTWSSSNNGVATVNNNGLVTAHTAGTADITVETVDGGFTSACTITVKPATIAVTGVSVTPTTTTIIEGNTQQLTATVSPTNATNKNVSWSSSNNAIATVDNNGLVTSVAPGTVTITVTTEDGGKTATCKVTVTQPVTGVSLNENSKTLKVGNNFTLIATVEPADATNKTITWSTSDATIATVVNGKVTAVTAGTVTITVTTADGNFKATCKVTVVVPVTGISLDMATATIIEGNSKQLTTTVSPVNATNQNVTWSSDNTAVATVDNNGMVTAIAPGTTNITVTTDDGGYEATCAVTVKPITIAVTGITVSPTKVTLAVGNTVSLTATVLPTNATNQQVDWSSSNNAVATVNANGVVTAKKIGYTTIHAITKDGNKKASCSVLVNTATVPVTGVSLDKTTATIEAGNTQQLTATVQPTNATNKDVIWSSNNVGVATVDNTGKVTAVAPGTANITVTTADGGKTAVCVVTVPDNTPPATPTITVVNHCGYSVLTAGNYTGELLWSNGKTDKQITVTTAGVYTLVQKVNGVSSNQASANVTIWQTPGKPTITVEVDTLTATAASKYYWFLDDSPITGNNMQKLVIDKSGNYSVQIESDKGCKSEVSDKIYVVFSSVEDQEVRIEVYPNPVTDELTVEGLPTAGTAELKLYNVAGQLIVHKRCRNSIEKIDMSDKVSGIYLLKIVDDNVSRSIKIVKR